MYFISTIGGQTAPATEQETTNEVRLAFAVPKSEENLRSSTIFDNEGSKQNAGGPATKREVPALK